MDIKYIILPTDFSKSARNASLYAISLFGTQNVEYTLLNCYAMPHSGADMLISLIDILRVESEEGLTEEQDRLEAYYPELRNKFKKRSVNGYLENVLSRMHREENFDLVVMGTTGASSMMKVLWGSNTTLVMKRLKMPVLAVPGELPFKKPHDISIALQQDQITGFHYPPLLQEIVEKNEAQVSIVSVEEESDALSGEELIAVSKGTFPTPFNAHPYQVLEKDPVQGVLYFVDHHQTDLLVMVSRTYGFLKKLFHQSSTREMAMISKIPLLVFHERS